jgi:hypothetical protein
MKKGDKLYLIATYTFAFVKVTRVASSVGPYTLKALKVYFDNTFDLKAGSESRYWHHKSNFYKFSEIPKSIIIMRIFRPKAKK